jgi:predicted ester cyclase
MRASCSELRRRGRRVRWDAVDIYRLRDGKISEEWAADDLTAILDAVGEYKAPWIGGEGR